jgi:FAD/FMN-containing dehydrogenase/Fe-S oxidoreductase
MSSETPDRPSPERDGRANYDYAGGDTERPEFAAELDARVDGDVRFDDYSRQLYATDASAYEVTPVGVVFPRSTADVASVVDYCADHGVAVLPRGGGTSLAGQAVNDAVVLDFTRHMDAVHAVDPDGATATAQAGVVLSDLNDAAAPHDLKFAPDPAAGDRSALGGAIGNNSTGAHSLQYGKTDAYVESVEAVLADGTVTTFGELTIAELRERATREDLIGRIHAEILEVLEEDADEIEAQYPDMKRNVSGYNLDVLLEEYQAARAAQDDEGADDPEDATVNLARLLAGSEGTLAIVTEATVSLEPVPETTSVALLTYDSLDAAMRDVPAILDHDAAAVELVDDVLIDLARETEEFADVVAMLPEATEAALLVEFYADSHDEGEALVEGLVADRVGDLAFDALVAHDAETQERFWKLRKAGLPILLSRTSDEKHISFIEDCAVPPEHLADYVADFQEILADHDTFASFYAHAGPGVLHVRPLINTKSETDLAAMEDIADRVTDLVVEYGGSVSGEHGDGRARTQWNRKLYGEDLWQTFRDLKSAFDPDWLLNPGQVCGDVDMTENLRFDPDYEFDATFDTDLVWENENGFQGMAELCHGCGGCRTDQDEGGVMCPTYRAAEEESLSTRGRANALRQAMSGDLPADPRDDEFAAEVMDLCIGCKGCARDCPSEVDMAKLKTEVTHARHQREGASLRERLFASVDTLSKWGSRTAPITNRLPELPGARTLLERTLGIARERSLPTFERETFRDWFAARGGAAIPQADASRRVVLFADTYTNYSNPDAGKAAVRVLEAAGVHVTVADRTDSGRPALSKGFVEQARDTAAANVGELEPEIRDGRDVVVVEPSDAVMFQSDLLDLLGGAPRAPESTSGPRPRVTTEDAETVAANTYGVCEYLDTNRLDDDIDWASDIDDSLTYHGHCHQKATKKDHHAVGVLRRAGFAVDPLDSGCCGMAGSFGYEAEHYSMSQAIGGLLFDQVEDSDAETVVAPGESCRTQLGDREGAEDPPHPVEKLAEAVADSE